MSDIPYLSVQKIEGPFPSDDGQYYIKWSYVQADLIETSIVFYDSVDKAKEEIGCCNLLMEMTNPAKYASRISKLKDRPSTFCTKESHPNRKAKRYTKTKKNISYLNSTFLVNLQSSKITGICALCGNLIDDCDADEDVRLVHKKCKEKLGDIKPAITQREKSDTEIMVKCDFIDHERVRHKAVISHNIETGLRTLVYIEIQNNKMSKKVTAHDKDWNRVNIKNKDKYLNWSKNLQKSRGGGN